jgi:prepilin-type N-terminal cleavage/methylation domain-containing protein
MKSLSNEHGFTLIELLFAMAVLAVVGLVLYSLLSFTTVLGAKNAAINTAHQQARTAMVRMQQDLHSAVSMPYLVDANGNPVTSAGPAAGISFQKWSSGPHLFESDAAAGQNQIIIKVTSGQAAPVVGQRVIVTSHQIEDDITAVSGTASSLTLTLAHNLPVAVTGTSTYSIACFITDRCSYTVVNGALDRQGPAASNSLSVIGYNITTASPFSTPTAATGSLYSRFVAAINLSTADSNYSNRGFKSANIYLNGQVPTKGRLTTYQ